MRVDSTLYCGLLSLLDTGKRKGKRPEERGAVAGIYARECLARTTVGKT